MKIFTQLLPKRQNTLKSERVKDLQRSKEALIDRIIYPLLILVFLLGIPIKGKAQIACGPVNTLYQTVGNSTLGVAEVYRYNNFQQTYLKVGELDGVGNNSATNSAYNATTQYIYSSLGGSTIRVYDPANNYGYVGDINITGNSQNFNHVLFAQGDYVGFVNGNTIVQFDVTGIGTYPATVAVVEVPIAGSSGPNDYALLGDKIYGVTGSTLRIINLTTNTLINRPITFDNALDGLNNHGGSFGAAWQDRNGNLYFFSNGGGGIYKITNVVSPSSTVAEKILLAYPSGQNDGFGCEIGPDPLDWDEDGVSDNVDLDDDNDGILDTQESGGTGIDPGGDIDGDAIYNFRDPDIAGYVDINGDTINDNFDSDLDGVPDAYDTDSDNDGCSDANEAYNNSSADGGDGPQYGLGDLLTLVEGEVLADGTVVGAIYPGTNVNVITIGPDGDGDGITDICDPDIVNPCIPDPYNVLGGDCDGDGVTNGDEQIDTTDPLDDCDYQTSSITVTVTSTSDCDGDGVPNNDEATDGTDGQDPCDFVLASQSIATSGTWNASDCDGDGVTNGDEITDGTDLTDPCDFVASDITLPVTAVTDCTAILEVTKIADTFGTNLGDTISYMITVENKGNVTLTNIVLTDVFRGVNGLEISLTQEPTFSSADLGSIEGTLLTGEIATYVASFTITQEAINAGGVANSIIAIGEAPNGDTVDDTSDDGDDFDGNVVDDPTVTELGCTMVFNEFSPNGDGNNDVLVINCIQNYPNNKLEIYNRWGNIVYEKQGYFNEFSGISNGRSIIDKGKELPVGTYYYILDLGNGTKPKVGWLYINR
jgi:gliding motility-associated-like protein